MQNGRFLRRVLRQCEDLHQRMPSAAQFEREPAHVLSGLRVIAVVVFFDRANAPVSENVLRRERASSAAIRTCCRAIVARHLALTVAGQTLIGVSLGFVHELPDGI